MLLISWLSNVSRGTRRSRHTAHTARSARRGRRRASGSIANPVEALERRLLLSHDGTIGTHLPCLEYGTNPITGQTICLEEGDPVPGGGQSGGGGYGDGSGYDWGSTGWDDWLIDAWFGDTTDPFTDGFFGPYGNADDGLDGNFFDGIYSDPYDPFTDGFFGSYGNADDGLDWNFFDGIYSNPYDVFTEGFFGPYGNADDGFDWDFFDGSYGDPYDPFTDGFFGSYGNADDGLDWSFFDGIYSDPYDVFTDGFFGPYGNADDGLDWNFFDGSDNDPYDPFTDGFFGPYGNADDGLDWNFFDGSYGDPYSPFTPGFFDAWSMSGGLIDAGSAMGGSVSPGFALGWTGGDPLIIGTGTVEHVPLEGGFYGIVADDGTRYDAFGGDLGGWAGQSVRYALRPGTETASAHLWGTPAEIVGIAPGGEAGTLPPTMLPLPQPILLPQLPRLDIPQLVTPMADNGGGAMLLRWLPAQDARRYEVLVYDMAAGREVLRDDVAGLSLAATLDPSRRYQAFVRPVQNNGTPGAWSAPFEFDGVSRGAASGSAGPGAPAVSGPRNAVRMGEAPEIAWTATAGANRYELLMYDMAAGREVLELKGIEGTSLRLNQGISAPSRYQVFVRGVTPTGTAGGWSSPIEFDVVAAPAAAAAPVAKPTLTGPATTVADAQPTITWTAVAGARQYELLVYDFDRGQEVISAGGISGTSFTVSSPLQSGARYQVFVRAVNSAGASPWASPLVFSVAGASLGRPVLTGPGTAASAAPPTITWSSASGAARYELLVYDMRAGAQVLHEPQIAGTSFRPASPLAPARYQVFVRAIDSAGRAGGWSSPLEFDVVSSGGALDAVFAGWNGPLV